MIPTLQSHQVKGHAAVQLNEDVVLVEREFEALEAELALASQQSMRQALGRLWLLQPNISEAGEYPLFGTGIWQPEMAMQTTNTKVAPGIIRSGACSRRRSR